jgi:WD40 repeat protein
VALGPVMAGSFSPTDRQIALQGADQIVRVWDVDTGRLLEEPYEHDGAGEALAYSPDGTRLLSGGLSGGSDIVLLDVATYLPIDVASMAGYHVSDVAWSPDGTRFALVSRGSGRIYIFTGDGESLTQRRPAGQWMWSVAYSEHWLAAGNELGAVFILRADDFALRREFWYDARMASRDLEISSDESMVVSCHIDGTINVYQIDNGWDVINSFPAHEYVKGVLDGCRDGVFSHDGSVYFSVGDDGWLRAWNVVSGELLDEINFDQPALMVDVSADGELVAVALGNGTLHLLGGPEAHLAQQ